MDEPTYYFAKKWSDKLQKETGWSKELHDDIQYLISEGDVRDNNGFLSAVRQL